MLLYEQSFLLDFFCKNNRGITTIAKKKFLIIYFSGFANVLDIKVKWGSSGYKRKVHESWRQNKKPKVSTSFYSDWLCL